MRTQCGTTDQDKILNECESFGGKAAEAAEIAADFDNQLAEALEENKQLKREIEFLESKIE